MNFSLGKFNFIKNKNIMYFSLFLVICVFIYLIKTFWYNENFESSEEMNKMKENFASSEVMNKMKEIVNTEEISNFEKYKKISELTPEIEKMMNNLLDRLSEKIRKFLNNKIASNPNDLDKYIKMRTIIESKDLTNFERIKKIKKINDDDILNDIISSEFTYKVDMLKRFA
jgi:hypothetical protein